MKDERFWSLIDASRQQHSLGGKESQLAQLKLALKDLTENELIAFNKIYHQYVEKASSCCELEDVCYIINHGCSSDCFDYFIDWIISMGKDIHHEALENPATLGKVAKPQKAIFENFRYVALEAFKEKFKKEMSYGTGQFSLGSHEYYTWYEDKLRKKYPELVKKMGF